MLIWLRRRRLMKPTKTRENDQHTDVEYLLFAFLSHKLTRVNDFTKCDALQSFYFGLTESVGNLPRHHNRAGACRRNQRRRQARRTL